MLRNIFYAKSILSRMGEATMSKRNYRSYNILGDEMKKELSTQENNLENDSKLIVENTDEEINANEEISTNKVTDIDSKKETVIKDIHVEDRQAIDMSIEIEGKDQATKNNRVFTSDSKKRKYLDRLNKKLDKIGTGRVESTKVPMDKSNDVEEDQLNNEGNTEFIQVGQSYKENYSSQNIENLTKENIENDTTFSKYKSSYKNKKRSKLAKWSMFIFKCILIVMLLPFIFILGAGILMFLGCFILGIVSSIGVGVYLIGLTSFYSTQMSEMLIALGITSSITMLSLGAILFILLIMMIRKIKNIIQKYRKTKKVNSNRESV